MQGNTKGGTPTKNDWWDSKPDNDMKLRWQEAVEDYLDSYDTDAEHVSFSMDLVKKMIPSMAVRDVRWKKFPKDQFDIQRYKSHRQLYDTIRNKLDSLVAAAEKERKDAEEKVALEKQKAQQEAELEKEAQEAQQARNMKSQAKNAV